MTQRNTSVTFGTSKEYIEVDVGPYEFSYVQNGNREVVVAEEDLTDESALDTRGELYTSLVFAWEEATKENPENPSGGRRRKTRKNKKKSRRRRTFRY